MDIKNDAHYIFVGGSSSNNIPSKYLNDSIKYLEEVFALEKDFNLVFGASKNGIMGTALSIARTYNRHVFGVCPEAYKSDIYELEEFYNRNMTFYITSSIEERTDYIFRYSDALLFLPGGIGTIYELFTAIERKRNGEIDKPIVIYNSNNYFDWLLAFWNKMYNESFANRSVSDCYHISYSAKDTVEYLQDCFDEGSKKERIIMGFDFKSDIHVNL